MLDRGVVLRIYHSSIHLFWIITYFGLYIHRWTLLHWNLQHSRILTHMTNTTVTLLWSVTLIICHAASFMLAYFLIHVMWSLSFLRKATAVCECRNWTSRDSLKVCGHLLLQFGVFGVAALVCSFACAAFEYYREFTTLVLQLRNLCL